MNKDELSWKLLFVALVLVIFGILLMFQSSNMLFEMNPLCIVVMALASLFMFTGIVLIVISMAAIASS